MLGTVDARWVAQARALGANLGAAAAGPTSGRIILLNGASSSGKSSIAGQLLTVLPDLNIHLAADLFYANTGWRDGSGAYRDFAAAGGLDAVLRRVRSGFHGAVAAVAAAGNNVVADHLFNEPWRLVECLERFAGLDVVFVGVRCPLAVLERRERERGDREPGAAAQQFPLVHAHGVYDVEVDTSLASPAECAQVIADFIASGAPRGAF